MGTSIDRRKELKKFAQSPFTFKLSADSARARQSPKKPRRVVFCGSCGSAKILGNARGDNDKKTVHYCDQECAGLAIAIVVAKDMSRPARLAKVRAGYRERSEAKRREVNKRLRTKCCLMCGKAHSKKAWCGKECANLSAKLRRRSRYIKAGN